MKKCKKCGVEKEESEFFKKRERGIEGSCKECRKKELNERIAKNPEAHKEKVRLRSEQRRQTEEWKEWRKDHQQRKRKEISEKSRLYYLKNKSIHEKSKEWREKNREQYRKSVKEHAKKNPLKVRARKIVSYHVQKGNMTRPSKCSRCLKECKTEAHHEDYTKPLDIVWLCKLCHAEEHRKLNVNTSDPSGHDLYIYREESKEVNGLC